MKERPILFSGPMVRAILEGRKTQTRRIAKGISIITGDDRSGATDDRCPYGVPGDLLWVREAWSTDPCYDHIMPSRLRTEWPVYYDSGPGLVITLGFHRVRPSIHMPRWASRLTLNVTGVKVERLNEISEQDARAEGVPQDTYPCDHSRRTCDEVGCLGPTYRSSFAALWDELHGAGAWDANPWVWVVEFKRVEAGS